MASREARTGAPETAESVVLVVDDEPDVASVTATYLERHLDGVAVTVESGGTNAIDRLEDNIDCVVSDYEMPDIDGLELLRRIRQRDADIPFILFTARGSEEIASEAISAGVTDYLQKGVGTDQYAVLANRIENAIARRESEAAAAETKTRYQRLLASSPHAVGVHDGEELLFANERFHELVGSDGDGSLVGDDPHSFVHEDDRDALDQRARRVLNGERTTGWYQWRVRRPTGEIRHVESRAAPVGFDGRAASQVVLRDVTERRRHECRIRTLHDATRRLVTAEEPDDVGEITMEAVVDVFEKPVAGLWVFDPAGGVLVPLAATESAKALAAKDDLDTMSSLPEWTVELAVFEAGEQRVIKGYADRDDTVTDEFETVLMHPLGRHGLLTIAAANGTTKFDESERDLVGILGRSVTAAMDRVGYDSV